MSHVRRALYIQLCGLLLFSVFAVWVLRNFPVMDWVLNFQRKIAQMEFWGVFLYPLLFGLGNVLLLPCGVLAVGSGVFFGLWGGFLLNLAGTILGAAIAFGVSRKWGRGWVQRKLFSGRKWSALDAAIEREGWKIIFLSQVHPLFPTSLLNYLYGMTRIRFWTCVLWVGLGQAPGLFLYAYFGKLVGLGLRVWSGQSHPFAQEYALWLGGLVLTLAVTTGLARLALRVMAEVETAADADRESSAR